MKVSYEKIVLGVIVLLVLGMRLYAYDERSYGEDFFYHYSVVEQALEKGKLSNDNDLVICYEGTKKGHPIGYYAPPYVLGKIIGIDAAFFITPIIFGVLTILLFYILVKLLFGRNVALLSALLIATSVAHITKSMPQTYRGDNLVYPFIVLSLICLYKVLGEKKEENKKLRFAVAAGLVSGATMIMWNGYILAIIIYFLTIGCYLLYRFYKQRGIEKKTVQNVIASLGAQSIMMLVLFLLADISLKGREFFISYYPLMLAGMCGYLYSLQRCSKKKSVLPLGVYGLIVAIIALLFRDKLYMLYAGFGSVKITTNFAFELLRPLPETFYFYYFITIIFAVLGLLKFIRLDENKAFFLGLLVPALYLGISAFRYMFFISLPLMTLTSLVLNTKWIIHKKYDLMKYIKMVVIVVMLLYPFYALPKLIGFQNEGMIEGLQFIRDNTPKDACIITYPNKGAVVEFFGKRHIYGNSLGVTADREKEIDKFLLTNETQSFNVTNAYLFVADSDLLYIELFAEQLGVNLSDVAVALSKVAENVYAPPAKDAAFIYIDDGEEKGFYYVYEKKLYQVQKVFVNGSLSIAKEGIGCMYINEQKTTTIRIYLGTKLCDTNLYKMITGQAIEGMEKIYFREGIATYKITNDRQKRE